jgi:hypothetical protein
MAPTPQGAQLARSVPSVPRVVLQAGSILTLAESRRPRGRRRRRRRWRLREREGRELRRMYYHRKAHFIFVGGNQNEHCRMFV